MSPSESAPSQVPTSPWFSPRHQALVPDPNQDQVFRDAHPSLVKPGALWIVHADRLTFRANGHRYTQVRGLPL